MPRPRSETPKEHTSIIRAKRKDGWTYALKAAGSFKSVNTFATSAASIFIVITTPIFY